MTLEEKIEKLTESIHKKLNIKHEDIHYGRDTYNHNHTFRVDVDLDVTIIITISKYLLADKDFFDVRHFLTTKLDPTQEHLNLDKEAFVDFYKTEGDAETPPPSADN